MEVEDGDIGAGAGGGRDHSGDKTGEDQHSGSGSTPSTDPATTAVDATGSGAESKRNPYLSHDGPATRNRKGATKPHVDEMPKPLSMMQQRMAALKRQIGAGRRANIQAVRQEARHVVGGGASSGVGAGAGSRDGGMRGADDAGSAREDDESGVTSTELRHLSDSAASSRYRLE